MNGPDPKTIQVCLYVDPMASMDSTPESEYDELEDDLRTRVFGDTPAAFARDVLPFQLANRPCDLYVIDFGGMAAQPGLSMGDHLSRELLAAVRDRPDTMFMVWSSFSARYFKGELFEELAREVGDEAAEDLEIGKTPVPANVILYPEAGTYGDAAWSDVRARLGLAAPPPQPRPTRARRAARNILADDEE